MRTIAAALAAFLLTSTAAFADQPSPPAATAETQADAANESEDQTEQARPAASEQTDRCRTVRRSESRLSSRRERACAPRPQPSEDAAEGDASDEAPAANEAQ
jgi:hypothetical protein